MTVGYVFFLSSLVHKDLTNLADKLLRISERSLDLLLKLNFRVFGVLVLQEVVLLVEDSFLDLYGADNMLNNRFLVLCLLELYIALSYDIRLFDVRVDTVHLGAEPFDLVFLQRFHQLRQD